MNNEGGGKGRSGLDGFDPFDLFDLFDFFDLFDHFGPFLTSLTSSTILDFFDFYHIDFFLIFTAGMVETWENQIQLLAKGDKQAYAAVFREFYSPLVMFACRFVTDRDAAEDIVQGFFCRVWEKRQQLTEIKSFRSYFYSSVRNRSLNYLRDHRAVSIEEAEVGKEEDFLIEMMEEEIYRELYAAIRRLPEKCQQIVLLKLTGKDNQEIANELQISEETVRSQLRRARELLHKRLSGLMALVVLALL